MSAKTCILLAASALSAGAESPAWEPCGVPYEMIRAERTRDDFDPVVPFEDAGGWRVECENAEAVVSSTTAHRLFGKGALKLVYRSTVGKDDVRHPVELPYAAERIEAFDREERPLADVQFAVTNGVTVMRADGAVWRYRVTRPKIAFRPTVQEALAPFAVREKTICTQGGDKE